MSGPSLVVGGTGFLGQAIVRALRADGHDVAILSRGQRPAPDGVRLIEGDRSGDLPPLGDFETVFDTSAYTPAMVDAVLDRLTSLPEAYVLISSLSVYGDFSTPPHEDDPVPDASAEDIAVARAVPPSDIASAAAYGASYGPMKRATEQRLAERLGDGALSLRVGVLIGAGDYTDRLTWWVRRIDEARGSRARVAVPGGLDRPVQMIDVTDVARFAIDRAQYRTGGVFNVTGPPVTFGDVIDTIANLAGSHPTLVPIPLAMATDAGLSPWNDIPLVVPDTSRFASFFAVPTTKAITAGLRARPLSDSLAEILTWDRTRRDTPLSLGIPHDIEATLIGG